MRAGYSPFHSAIVCIRIPSPLCSLALFYGLTFRDGHADTARPCPPSLPRHPLNPAMMVADATRWALQSLSTVARPLCAPPGLGTFALPPEIILEITSHLNNPSMISLALTCRTLHWLCFPEHLVLDKTEKQELLLWLEKDVATLYFCHYCVKLHRWHRRWSRSITPWYEELMPCKETIDNHLVHPPTCHIPYYVARLVMNRHFYGPKHGPPAHILEDRNRLYHADGVVNSVSQHARIVDDQLLVLTVISSSHSRGDSTSLRSHIDSFGHSVCTHITLSEQCPDYAPIQLPELAKNEVTQDLFLPCNQAFGSCAFCLTDYSISITRPGKKKGYVVEVFIHRQLGDCRSPFDWSWRTMSAMRTGEEPRIAHPSEYRPGCVRDRWNKAEGIANKAHGRFVTIPGLDAEKSNVGLIE
jgi:hypothetical protein